MKKNLIILILVSLVLTSYINSNSEKDQKIKELKSDISMLENINDSLIIELNKFSDGVVNFIKFRHYLEYSESRHNPKVVNKIGAQGLFQFMPCAKIELGLNPNHPVHEMTVEQQHDLFSDWVLLLENKLQYHIKKYENTYIFDTILVTKSGIIAAAHLGGCGGVKEFLRTGGKHNPDDNWTSLSDYMYKFQGYNF
jgi:hypothetical protein